MTEQHDLPPLINPYDDANRAAPSERDSAAGAPATSHRRAASPAPPAGAPSEEDETLVLPRGALVGLRKSGGFAFSTREVVVLTNGRVLRRSEGAGRAHREDTAQRLSKEQLAELAQLVKQASFPRFAGAARRSPDALIYEIAARVGRSVKVAEVAQGNLPDSLKPLISWLERLLLHGAEQSGSHGF